jgi:ATP-dependent helicase Lhr and Lhr-like helicase
MDGLPFHPATRAWFEGAFQSPTKAQRAAWTALSKNESTLLVAPTGSGKTLAAFLHAIDRRMFDADAPRVLYISPLKALAVDIERNLQAPLKGIAMAAERLGASPKMLTVGVRTGDTSAKERAHIAKHGADILVTTPESLYLMLTSNAAQALAEVGVVILDEIHALVPTKRGAHLAVSLERLEALRLAKNPACAKLTRIGLSATQRPLDEVARYLGGALTVASNDKAVPRAITIADGRWEKTINIFVDVPVEDMTHVAAASEEESGRGIANSMWAAIQPKLLEYIQKHNTTIVFVNNRRLAERLASAVNDLAGEVLAHAHHGSLAREQRTLIEDALKRGQIRALVATSSLELGIDMGAVDLVIQVEAPPSIASGIQRIGRAGHQVGAPSNGVVFPKFRSDLLACAAMVEAVHEGQVESTRYPRNPLDVCCQQIVAIVASSEDDTPCDALYTLLRQSAPFADLTRQSYENCLDLLSGRYESDDFAELRPRLSYDRVSNLLRARPGAKRVAILNAGTIPDRGLYAVFLLGAPKGQGRVGELDEEMVFEIKPGDCFMLGASTWRTEEITFDRVLVSPAPGQPGRMPFWRGENQARPLEFGKRIGALARKLQGLAPAAAQSLLTAKNGLGDHAATNLIRYIQEQAEHSVVPDDRTVVVEAGRDELGDWRICVLSPLGGQILAPWSIAIMALAKEKFNLELETVWSNDGFVIRAPENADLEDFGWIVIDETEIERLLYLQLARTSMFAARFREASARALLLTRKRPGMRTPLWQQRKKATDLLASASRFPSFPMVLETYRELVGDVFDLVALKSVLRDLRTGKTKLAVVAPKIPSPFGASILFGYAANYLYEGDAPPTERRAQALAVDLSQLRDLLGELELRELLDGDSILEVYRALQALEDEYKATNPEQLYDLLLRLGDLNTAELEARTSVPSTALADVLIASRRALWFRMCGEDRLVPLEYVSRYCEALGLPIPRGVVSRQLGKSEQPLTDLVLRFARTRAPFAEQELQDRYGIAAGGTLKALVQDGRLLSGAFTPGRSGTEYAAPSVLERIRRRALTRLRNAVSPAPPKAYARALTHWQGLTKKRRGLDALLDVLEQLQGLPMQASLVETEFLPARIENYAPSDLDTLVSSGEVTWVGVEAAGSRDGLVALYLSDNLHLLRRPKAQAHAETRPALEQRILEALKNLGALFTSQIAEALKPLFAPELEKALWSLVFSGAITNDSMRALRTYLAGSPTDRGRGRDKRSTPAFRSRRAIKVHTEGRWSLLSAQGTDGTAHLHAKSASLLARYGLVTREVAELERIPGGFSGLYDVYKQMEDRGRIRRGYFVEGIPAMQFAQSAAVELLRSMDSKKRKDADELLWLSTVDPANAYGALLPWPTEKVAKTPARPMRAVGSYVALHNGALLGWLSKSGKSLRTFLSESEPERRQEAQHLAGMLLAHARSRLARRDLRMLEEVDGVPAEEHPLYETLQDAGFENSANGLRVTNARAVTAAKPQTEVRTMDVSIEDEIARELQEAGLE